MDKFVGDEQVRNILCDVLGDRMALIQEYGKNKENKGVRKGIRKGVRKGEDRMIRNQLKSGISADVIARTNKVSLSRVRAVERSLKSKI